MPSAHPARPLWCLSALALLAALLAPLTACDDPLVIDAPFSCTTSADCGAGQACLAGVCMTKAQAADILSAGEAFTACPQGACDDGDPCTTDACDISTGCTHTPATDGTSCDDGSACTEADTCKAGACEGGKPKACDDAKACTIDGCDPKTGCTHVNATLVCDDGDACTVFDVCKAGKCTPGEALACDDGKVCTADSCDKADGCTYTPSEGACDDGDPCTQGDTCAAGACTSGKALPCECEQNSDCAKFDDGNPCTGIVVCGAAGLPGKCTLDAGTVVVCDGSLDTMCLKTACDPKSGQCVPVPVQDSTTCDDSDACTLGERCKSGKCAGGKAVTCDDAKACTLDACDEKTGCIHDLSVLDGKPCDADGDACTISDLCASGACLPGPATTCDDANDCTIDACDKKKGCAHTAKKDGAACDDASACTADDTCEGGVCGGKTKPCDDGNACTVDLCDKMLGCVHKAAKKGATCDDGDACTSGDGCAGIVCKGGKAKSCDDGKPCAVYACDAKSGACSKKPASDGTACGKSQGACSKGACIGTDSAGRKWGLVPAGMFYMGCNAALDKGCNEKPQHEVVISKAFWLGLYEVTVEEYKACAGAGKCSAFSISSKYCNWGKSDRSRHPVNCVDWSNSVAYCQWAGGTLATEAQWALAARGRCEENGGVPDCAKKMRVYPWGNNAPVCGQHAVFKSGGHGCGKGRTWAVGTGRIVRMSDVSGLQPRWGVILAGASHICSLPASLARKQLT